MKKDEVLNNLSERGNVAQFISFVPGEDGYEQTFCRIRGVEPNHLFLSVEEGVERLLKKVSTVNIRRFTPDDPKGTPLIFDLSSVSEVMRCLGEAFENKYHVIVNEGISVRDGGVSGVVFGGVIEFSPGDTPKCVDKPGVCRLPFGVGVMLLEEVYEFPIRLNPRPGERVEFSLHPKKVGYAHDHIIFWESEVFDSFSSVTSEILWPNNFSRFLGDKIFGLLVAQATGLRVPKTTVISRNVAIFTFGRKTGETEKWIRTCPEVPHPGYYSTFFGWKDPFEMIKEEEDVPIKSIICQESVKSVWSGAVVQGFVQGAAGAGDGFMTGKQAEDIPEEVVVAVKEMYERAERALGGVKMEWVFDGAEVWCVQLHRESGVQSDGVTVVEGAEGVEYVDFFISEEGSTKDKLNKLYSLIKTKPEGINVVGNVGVCSHYGDILRKAGIPSKISAVKGE